MEAHTATNTKPEKESTETLRDKGIKILGQRQRESREEVGLLRERELWKVRIKYDRMLIQPLQTNKKE